jgi:hypothetical protein
VRLFSACACVPADGKTHETLYSQIGPSTSFVLEAPHASGPFSKAETCQYVIHIAFM